MNKHIKECAEVFLRDQGRLFDEPVVFDEVRLRISLRNVLHSIARILRN